MKVVQVNCVYKKGSTGKITYDLHMGLLEEGIDSVVCYGRGEVIREYNVFKTCPEWYSKLNNVWSRITGVMYGGCFFSTNRLISIIKKEKPDVVHLQCINGYFVNIYRLINWLKEEHIKTVLTLHAEFMYTGGCGHSIDCNQWNSIQGCGRNGCPYLHTEINTMFLDRTHFMWDKIKKAFDGFDGNLIVTSVSPWLMERAKSSPVLYGKSHRVVMNGIDTSIFHPYTECNLRDELDIHNEKVVLHVTPCFSLDKNHIKGGYYVTEFAKRVIDSNIKIVVVGDYPEDVVFPDNMIMAGAIFDRNKLAQLYSMADVTLLTSKRETFSMITAESMCSGTPVVGFKAGGPEQIAIPEYCRFVEYGDVDMLTCEVLSMLNKPKDLGISINAKKKYSIDNMVRQYCQCYTSLLKNKELE